MSIDFKPKEALEGDRICLFLDNSITTRKVNLLKCGFFINWLLDLCQSKKPIYKKAEQICSAFSPNLTMNLTYLCYGSTNV